MPSFKAIALKHQIKTDKTVNLKIRVTQNRKSKYIGTGITASTADLTKTMKIKTQSFIDDTNDKIKTYRDKCNQSPALVEKMTIDQLIDFLTTTEKEVNLDYIAFGKSHIEKLQSNNRERTAQDYQTAINALKRYIGRDQLLISEITVKFLNDFAAWIVLNPINAKKKTTMSRAPSHYLSSLRALHNEMKAQLNDEDRGIIHIPYSPFVKFKMPAVPITKKRAIDAELIKQIFDLPGEDITNSKGTNRYDLAKDCFILSFCLLGMNSADLFECTEINSTRIIYKRKKTRSRRRDEAEISVQLQPEIASLIEKYKDKTGNRVFNFYQTYTNESNFNKAINKGLKTVGKKIKIEDLEFYAARHSWATIALNKAGIEKYTVHSALNHVDDAMKVTDIYLDKDWSLINDANRKVLDFVFKKKEDPKTEKVIGPKTTKKQRKLTEPVPES